MGWAIGEGQGNITENAAVEALEKKIPLLKSVVIFHGGIGENRLLTKDQVTGRGFDEDEGLFNELCKLS